MAKGRHMLMISLHLGGQWHRPGGQWHRPHCLAWWESLSSMQAGVAPLMRAATHDRAYFESTYDRGQILTAVHMLESYDVLSTIVVQWDVTTLPDQRCDARGVFPLHCFDAAPVFKGAFAGLHITDADIARIACASKANYSAVVKFKRNM